MKFLPLFLILLFLPVCSAIENPPSPVYPVAPSGAEFQKEVEAFVTGMAFYMPETNAKERLKNDPRDWESALEKLIRENSIYGIDVSSVAFGYTVHRGTAGRPEIVAATGEFFNRHVREALERYEEYSQRGNPTHTSITGAVPRITHAILKVGSPAHLTRALDYLNSPADEKIRLIDRNTPVEVATALRSYGEAIHIEAAEKFAKRLRDVGKDDIADDIDRSIERIEKDGKRAQATPSREAPAAAKENVREKDNAPAAKDKKGLPLPWIAAAIALTASLIFFLKRKLTP